MIICLLSGVMSVIDSLYWASQTDLMQSADLPGRNHGHVHCRVAARGPIKSYHRCWGSLTRGPSAESVDPVLVVCQTCPILPMWGQQSIRP